MIDFNQLINTGKATLGTEKTLKELKLGKLAKVYVTNNCPSDVKEDVERHASIAKTEIEHLDIPNQELGTLCKKPFSISLLGQLR